MNLFQTDKLSSRICALLILSSLLGLSLFFESCTDRCEERLTVSYYEPVYTPLSVIRGMTAMEM